MNQKATTPRSAYSCKRKKDYITILGLFLFLFVIAFELYLVLWVPVQLKSGRLLEKEVAKQTMISFADSLRETLASVKPDGDDQKGELAMAVSVIDSLAAYIRENQDHLDREQIRTLEELLRSYNDLALRWKSGKFIIKEEKLDFSNYLKALKAKTEASTAKTPAAAEQN